jgi:hypothetical protein
MVDCMNRTVEGLLARVPKGRMANIMSKSNRLRQIFVKA